jgi:hypothetical protein
MTMKKRRQTVRSRKSWMSWVPVFLRGLIKMEKIKKIYRLLVKCLTSSLLQFKMNGRNQRLSHQMMLCLMKVRNRLNQNKTKMNLLTLVRKMEALQIWRKKTRIKQSEANSLQNLVFSNSLLVHKEKVLPMTIEMLQRSKMPLLKKC